MLKNAVIDPPLYPLIDLNLDAKTVLCDLHSPSLPSS